MTIARTATTISPPVMESRRWLEGVEHPENRPLINVSQAAPVDPPPPAMLEAMAQIVVTDPEAHLYGPVLGLPALRDKVASKWTAAYNGKIAPCNVAITSGCNQAFAAAIATLCGEDDEVIIPVPYYFNHAMWLDMSGVKTIALETSNDLVPAANDAAALITEKTRAIALVTPNNPAGVEYPSETLSDFYELAQKHGIALIIDETYRDFDSRLGAPHELFQNDDWGDTLIQLYSFSKAYRLTGHRVGALIASKQRLAEVEKFLDTVTICPNQIGQRAALWGMQNLDHWLADERLEILDRRAAIADNIHKLHNKGWELRSCGAYFAYLKHPFDIPSDELAPLLVKDVSVLALPGTMFMPIGSEEGKTHLRIAFANVDRAAIGELFDRLASFTP